MFEALRGLRDAVAPESGNLGGQNNLNTTNGNDENMVTPDTDELWQAYKASDPDVLRLVESHRNKNDLPLKITTREDFIRWHAKMEMEKDTELVMKSASTVLLKSAQIDKQVDEEMPGIHRTRDEQMQQIERLIQLNSEAAENLQSTYAVAREKRDACRRFIKVATAEALGVNEETEIDVGAG